jgi:hypothetical protein
MAQYIPFAPNVEVNGQTILSFVNALAEYKDIIIAVLARHGLKDIDPQGWYPQENWLNAFKEIGEQYGPNTLFAIGKAIPESAIFPPEIQGLEMGLSAINIAYHMNHRGGEIGSYTLVSYNPKDCIAVMECPNPYPSHFDRGIITTMVRKFKAPNMIMEKVELDTTKPTRLNGADSCFYNITWMEI